MIIDTFSGRSPLYHIERTFAGTDNELLFGKDYLGSEFNDDAIGRTLDKIQSFGCEKLYTELSLGVVKKFSLNLEQSHFDTTSINVWGDYERKPKSGQGQNITYGYSKDKRGDLKQLMMSLTCVEGNIPILGKTEDGNSSDENLNNDTLIALNKFLKEAGGVNTLYVADAKVVTAENLELLEKDEYITRLPATHKIHGEVIDKALKANEWVDLGILSQTATKNTKQPNASYRIWETEITLYGQKTRAIVVHTTAKDKSKSAGLDRRIEKESKSLSKELKKASKVTYHCLDDCQKSMEKRLGKQTKFHILRASITQIPVYKKGRIKEGAIRAIDYQKYQICYDYSLNQEAVKQRRDRDGCFVLIASVQTKRREEKAKNFYSLTKGKLESKGTSVF